MPITSGELWLEGSAENKREALANAILNASEIPPTRPGMKTIITIDTIWEDDEGRFHAKIMFQEVPDPGAPENDEEDNEEEIIKHPHDELTKAHGPEDDALRYTPDMEDAEHKMEEEFDEATHEKPDGSEEITAEKKLDNKAQQPTPVPDGTEDKEES